MLYSLNDIKNYLYIKSPMLYDWYDIYGKSLSDFLFIQIFFPEEFYASSYTDSQNKQFSLQPILKNKSQLSLVMNHKYIHSALSTRVSKILTANPSIWEDICRRCERELSKSCNKELLQDLTKLTTLTIGNQNINIKKFVINLLTYDTSTAFAIIILFSLLDGIITKELEEMLLASTPFKKQFSYLNSSIDELDFSFCSKSYKTITDYLTDHSTNYTKYSEIFSLITSINGETIANPLSFLYTEITSKKDLTKSRKLISISGECGTGKHLITQQLYLNMCYAVLNGYESDLAPFYINLNRYIQYAIDHTEKESIKLLEKRFHQFQEYCEAHTNRAAILFIDGIKEYELFDSKIDFYFNSLLSKMYRIQLVISKEKGVSINQFRQRNLPGFATGKYDISVNLHPLAISEANMTLLNNHKELFNISTEFLPTDELIDRLNKLNIKRMDFFQIERIIPRLSSSNDLADLYNQICTEYLDGDFDNELANAPQWAFDFEYTDKRLPNISLKLCSLLTAHESIINFHIAKYYISKIRSGNSENIDSLEMILPSKVNYMLAPLLNKAPATEEYLLKLVEKNYSKMSLLTKAEMIHWLGRVKHKGIIDRANALLSSIYDEEKNNIPQNINPYSYERKLYIFLMREITISLIILGHVEISNEYIELLIKDKQENELNRGFHLEYYDDKPFIPAYDTLDFADDITLGKRTLEELISKVENNINDLSFSPLFDLNLFTVCSLIQTRIESTEDTFPCIDLYLEKACSIIQWYLNNKASESPQIFIEYLIMLYNDFNHHIYDSIYNNSNLKTSLASTIFSFYSDQNTRGNCESKITKNGESLYEHAYNSWLIGLMFLPDNYPGYSEYSKETILNLLLLHILEDESFTHSLESDLQNSAINLDKNNYTKMGIFLSRGSYSTFADTTNVYKYKHLWYDKNNINGRLAQEISTIQTLNYYLGILSNPNIENVNIGIDLLLKIEKDITSALGKKIYKMLIQEATTYQSINEFHTNHHKF